MKHFKIIFLLLAFVARAGFAEEITGAVKAETLLPSGIPPDINAVDVLTKELRGKVRRLGLNNIEGVKDGGVSRALLLLPRDRARAGVISFEIGKGLHAGVYQCEALGRGATAFEPKPGWTRGLIGGTTIYYAPLEVKDGATVPGIYDLRNITPDRYEIALLGGPGGLKGEIEVLARTANPDGKAKPFFSAVWRHWYSEVALSVPVDMAWAEDSQEGSQGEGRPVFERRPKAVTPEEKARQAAQLAHGPRYYFGPYGRSGWAVHTDRWEDAERLADPKYAGRPEAADFRFRDTSGCVKLRPGCLAVLNDFVSEQEGLGRRVQLEVRETTLLDSIPARPYKKSMSGK